MVANEYGKENKYLLNSRTIAVWMEKKKEEEEDSTSHVIASLLRFFAMLTLFFLWI